ncbi:MAG TPA: alpha/beta fold hydrolase [Gemmatimonadales bacterium]|nr:alpha/beta fold hydrolase [Gemmatimonadales bacterium]
MRVWLAWSLLIPAAVAARQTSPPIAPKNLSRATPSTITSAPDQFAQLRDVRLRYREAGLGEPVLLIHGLGASLEVLASLGDSLAVDHHVIAFDVRGFGQSTKFARPHDYGRAMADDVIHLLDHLHIQRAHVIGHSMGALIAANLAERYPGRVASATLIAGPFWPDSVTAFHAMAPWEAELQAGRGMTALLRWLFPRLDSASAVTLDRQLMASNDLASLEAVIPSLGSLVVGLNRPARMPVLIAAAGDSLNAYSHALAAHWASARLLEFPTASHAGILNQPGLLTAIRQIARAKM